MRRVECERAGKGGENLNISCAASNAHGRCRPKLCVKLQLAGCVCLGLSHISIMAVLASPRGCVCTWSKGGICHRSDATYLEARKERQSGLAANWTETSTTRRPRF